MFKSLRGAALAISLCLLASNVSADERPLVKLLRPDSLLGWEHGRPPFGWSIKEGMLTAGPKATTLVSGWTLGDFEMRFAWNATPSAELDLQLIGTAGMTDVHVRLRHDGAALEMTTPNAGGTAQATSQGGGPAGEFRTGVLRRQGDVLHLITERGGQSSRSSLQVPSGARFSLRLAARGGMASIKDLQLKESPGDELFDGHSLAGWWTPGNKQAWHAENGELVKRGNNGNYLRTEDEFANFTLSLEYLIQKGNNSGIGIRTAKPGWPSGEGMELQLLDQPGLDKHSTMAIYGNLPPVARADKSEQWNHAVIKAEGPMVTAWINGELVQHVNTRWLPELKHRHAQGWIGLQDHGGVARFRNMRILEAPDGAGPDAWHQPPPTSGVDLLLDRLMNSERLAQQDGVRSGVAAVATEKTDSQTLAKLTGPGALVGLYRTNDAGTLEFYFDGEAKPRITAPAKSVENALPRLMEENYPLVTYMPYQESLKIVLKDGAEGTYRLPYVTLPADVAVETFQSKLTAAPERWASPIQYRHAQHSHGGLRIHDPHPKLTAPAEEIGPGSARQLVALDGKGQVDWLQLEVKPESLANDDLWLEVRVDGEEQPAINAPARYLFAPVRDKSNHHNFVATYRPGSQGYVLRLAMPFGDGLTITAHNRGEKPLKGVGTTVSYRLVTDDPRQTPFAERMRLRGDFATGDEANTAKLDGPGRWVGLVCNHGDGSRDKATIKSLAVDGQTPAAWQDVKYEFFLGQHGTQRDFRRCLSGAVSDWSWHYALLAPVEFDKSLELTLGGPSPMGRLVLYYQQQP